MDFVKIAQEIEASNKKEILKKFLLDMTGSQEPFKGAAGKNGLLGWLLSPQRERGAVTRSSKMDLVPQLKGHPVFDSFVKLLFESAVLTSKILYSDVPVDSEFDLAEKMTDARSKLDQIIENRKFLEKIIENSNIYGELLGKGWRSAAIASRIINHVKEFLNIFNNEYYSLVMKYFDQEVEKTTFSDENKEKYLNETLVIWMMKNYPTMLGLSSNREVLFDQIDRIHQFDLDSGSDLIAQISKFLQKAQLAGLGSKDGPSDEVVQKLNEKREEIYSSLTQVPALNDPNVPEQNRLKESRPIGSGRNALLRREDFVQKLDNEYSITKSLSKEDQDKIAEINNKIEEVKKKTNSGIAKAQKALEGTAMYGLDSKEYRKQKEKVNQLKEQRKGMIDALEKEKAEILRMKKEANMIMKELGL